jgi:hypothetical protein
LEDIMKNLRVQLRYVSLQSLILLAWMTMTTVAYAQITPLGDAFTNTADPTTNYGAATTLAVDGANAASYIRFNLASIPTTASVSQATLKLYVNTVTTAGSFNVDYVNGAWAENTIDASNAPSLGSTIASGVSITTADKNQYILINVTSAVLAWLDGSETNNGIALVANSTFYATFDSKENTTTSHPAELDIAFAGGDGTITGVSTASGSGLTGGGTSGTLKLSLTNACAANQVLQWSGSAWACASAGTGTVTSVATGTGLTGGPITGSGTLSINTSVVPQLGASNTFIGNQTVDGNMSATGVVTGSSFQIGSNLFGFGSYANQNAFLGFAGNSASTGTANTGVGVQAIGGLFSFSTASANTATGYLALSDNTSGGYNTASGFVALNSVSTGINNTGVGAYSGATMDDSLSTGSNNTFVGYSSEVSTGSLSNDTVVGASSSASANNATTLGFDSVATASNATAIGANAEVAENNALVLGSINGVNGAIASTFVGIGTTTPSAALDVLGNTTVHTLIGNGGCGSSYAGIGFIGSGGFNSNCVNFALLGENNGNLYVNSSGSGSIFFRNQNGANLMTIDTAGDVTIKGSLSKGSGSFKIDDPLDPANKYLYHSFVESPDMMDIYNGVATLDAHGAVWITLPSYFEALNRDFRYQLTSIGRPQPSLYVATEVSGNRFKISGGKAGALVSWQVTGIRHDAYANAHRIPNEEEKSAEERGKYLHPELFGASQEQAVGYRSTSPSTGAEQVFAAAKPQ